MAHHQKIEPIGLSATFGNRRQVVERQDLPVINHQHFDPRIVVEEQGAAAAMDVVLNRRTDAVHAQ
ncbi:hypothetical protein D3C84_927880 [compost metagenome]